MSTVADNDALAVRQGSALGALVPWIVAAAVLIALPFVFTDRSAITIMNQMMITVVFALSYNMLLGQGGMLSFGHAVYMGLGGFFCMHVINWVEDGDVWMSLPLLPLLGGLFGMGFALIIGAFSTRKAGTVFAMISLGIGELVAACSIIIVAFFGGEEGISGDRSYAPFLGIEFFTQTEVYYLIAFWTVLSAALMFLFSRTPLGRMANAVRDNPERAEFLGYSSRWVRYGSFVFAGFFAGVAGALFAINYEILTEENLNLVTSGEILLVTFLGGVGLFIGPIIGAVAFTLVQTVLSLQTELWALYAGALFVATVMFFPGGLAGLLAMHVVPARLGNLGLLAVPYAKTLIPGAVTVLAAAGILEMMDHLRNSTAGDEVMTLYWIETDTASVIPWILYIAIAAGALWLTRKGAPEVKQAWDRATTVGGRR